MNPLQFLLILRARYKIALLTLLLTVAAAMTVIWYLPKYYIATASVLVDVKSPDPIAAMLMPSSLSTQVDIISSERVARKVVRMLRLDENPIVKQQWTAATQGSGKLDVWLAQHLLKGLQVTPSRDSNIIFITYKGADPGFAAAIANAFAQAYIDTTIELKVEPARQYALWFGDQGKALRENLEKAQSRLSEFQQQKGIVAREEQLDTEMAKLSELSSQLTVVQAQTSDARSKQNSGTAADSLPEILQNPLISGLKSDIARQEAKLQEAAVNLDKNHPQYQRMQSEIAALKQKLEAETRHVTSGFSTSRTVGIDKEAELRSAIARQKEKLLDLKTKRDQLAVLQRDVDAAKSAYDTVISRYNQNNLASQATQTNVSVLTQAVEPLEPSFPKPLYITSMMAIALGFVCAGVMAFMVEMFDKRVRSAHDLAEMLQVPVLGVIIRAKTRSRLAFWRRGTTLAIR